MRLDHFLISPKLSDRLVDGGVNRWARGQVNASDHAPTFQTFESSSLCAQDLSKLLVHCEFLEHQR